MAKIISNHLSYVAVCSIEALYYLYFDNSLPSSDKDFEVESQQLWAGKNTQSNLRHDGKRKMHFAVTKESVNPLT